MANHIYPEKDYKTLIFQKAVTYNYIPLLLVQNVTNLDFRIKFQAKDN